MQGNTKLSRVPMRKQKDQRIKALNFELARSKKSEGYD